MEMIQPTEAELEALAWLAPLAKAAARARARQHPVPLLLDQFRPFGRIDRRVRPTIWVYEHIVTRQPLALDDTGQAYRFLPSRKDPYGGQFRPMPLRTAIYQAVAGHDIECTFKYVDPKDWDELVGEEDDEPPMPTSWADKGRRRRMMEEAAERCREEDAACAAEAAEAAGTVRATSGNLRLVVTDDPSPN